MQAADGTVPVGVSTRYIMNKILILFAHPRYEQSRVNRALLTELHDREYITIHDLYEEYPNFNIDVAREKELLLSHQIIVWHYPFYMYSAPAMIKQWIDQVLEHGWAHGADGIMLKNKLIFSAITTGGTKESYSCNGFNRHSIPELLIPLEQTANLCKMTWLQPFVVQGTYRLTDDTLAEYAVQYRQLLRRLVHTHPVIISGRYEFLNDWIADMNVQETP
jgi:glutathione-regulated potassium-efflux system ancillary protein KefG